MRTVYSTISGLAVDLQDPQPEQIDLDDIAIHLSKVNRYNGGVHGDPLSVAQHSVMGADYILSRPYNDDPQVEAVQRHAAAYFLLHDAPEYALGDDITPKKNALRAICREFGVAADVMIEQFDTQVERFDRVIHAAAGLAWPPPLDMLEPLKWVDQAMLVTEWRDLRAGVPLPEEYEDVHPFDFRIEPWPWRVACETFRGRMHALLPVFQG